MVEGKQFYAEGINATTFVATVIRAVDDVTVAKGTVTLYVTGGGFLQLFLMYSTY